MFSCKSSTFFFNSSLDLPFSFNFQILLIATVVSKLRTIVRRVSNCCPSWED